MVPKEKKCRHVEQPVAREFDTEWRQLDVHAPEAIIAMFFLAAFKFLKSENGKEELSSTGNRIAMRYLPHS